MPLQKPESIEMKGFTEDRGLAFKLDYDADTKQFVSKLIEHGFQPKAEAHPAIAKVAELRKRYRVKKTRENVAKQMAAMGPELRDDVGMTEVHAASPQP